MHNWMNIENSLNGSIRLSKRLRVIFAELCGSFENVLQTIVGGLKRFVNLTVWNRT